MQITEVNVSLQQHSRDHRLKAYCAIVIDDAIVIHGLKVVDIGERTIVAMPNHRRHDACPKCNGSNHLKAGFCNRCGGQLDPTRHDPHGRPMYEDVAHPINEEGRKMIESAVLEAYDREAMRVFGEGILGANEEDQP